MQNKNNEIFSDGDKLKNLCEEIGDLFYDDFALFLFFLGEESNNKEIEYFLKEAYCSIEDAWDICEKYTPKNDKNSKHSSKVKSINLTNKELAQKVGNLKEQDLKEFLLFLTLKIARDSYADKMRGRELLSTHLKQCAFLLKKAFKSLGKIEKEDSQIQEITKKINDLLCKEN